MGSPGFVSSPLPYPSGGLVDLPIKSPTKAKYCPKAVKNVFPGSASVFAVNFKSVKPYSNVAICFCDWVTLNFDNRDFCSYDVLVA